MHFLWVLPRQGLSFLQDIKLAHTLFSLPFFMVSAAFCWQAGAFLWSWQTGAGLLLALLCARTFAMGCNRLVDAKIDGLCPRTRMRAIPQGVLFPSYALGFTLLSAAFFILCAWMLGPYLVPASIAVLCVLGVYPWMKRMHVSAHYYLGLCLAMVPLAVSYALTQSLLPSLWLLSAGVLLWVGGFDILYAIDDEAFDRSMGLQSIPGRYGAPRARQVALGSYVSSLLFFSGFGLLIESISPWYFVGIAVMGASLAWQIFTRKSGRAVLGWNAWLGVYYLLLYLLTTF